MKNKMFALTALAVAASGAAAAPLLFDQNVTNNVIVGTGIDNGGFTVDTANGIEIGLRGRIRFDAGNNPTQTTNSNGLGTYSYAAGHPPVGYSWQPGSTSTAIWNFDWSINTGTAPVGAYTYRLGMDFEPGVGTNYQIFDLIHVALADHAFGNNGTAQGAGVEATDAANYAVLLAGNNLVQNSWNYQFFDSLAFPFNANTNGNYTIFLEAIGNGQVLARSEINVVVGSGAVPEPGSLALAGLAMFGLAAVRRRKGT